MGVEIHISFGGIYIYIPGEVLGPSNWQGVEHVALQIDRSGYLRRCRVFGDFSWQMDVDGSQIIYGFHRENGGNFRMGAPE